MEWALVIITHLNFCQADIYSHFMCRALNLGIVEFRKQCTYTHVYMRQRQQEFQKAEKKRKNAWSKLLCELGGAKICD